MRSYFNGRQELNYDDEDTDALQRINDASRENYRTKSTTMNKSPCLGFVWPTGTVLRIVYEALL